jgi:hypothetical protein
MAQCSVCRTETQLFINGIPLCTNCADALEAKTKASPPSELSSVRRRLEIDEKAARQRHLASLEQFRRILDEIPWGIPHPDGSERIRQASERVRFSREKYDRAHERLINFLTEGVIPEAKDPKR